MRRLVVSCIAAAALAVSSPAIAQPLAVAQGEDLSAWQALEQQRLEGDAAVVAYRRYVETWVDSPLAVVAWGRLAALGAEGAWGDASQVDRLEGVRARWQALRTADARPTRVAQLMLPPTDDATVDAD